VLEPVVFSASVVSYIIIGIQEVEEELVEDLEHYGLLEVSGKALQRMLAYNVPGGKLNRGLTVVQAALCIREAQWPPLGEQAKREDVNRKEAEGLDSSHREPS